MPELAEAIAKWTVKKTYVDTFPERDSFEHVNAHVQKMKAEAEAKGELVRSVTSAVQMDSRQSTTREYYERIAEEPSSTAITVCER